MLDDPGLYVHLPWCLRKCPYCDFNSHTLKSTHLGSAHRFEEYTSALLQDLEHQCRRYEPPPLGSIFFGGGTPSLFSPDHIRAIVERAQQLIGFSPDIEITLEANPGTAEYFSFKEYNQAGVNRISLGIQSFSDRHLARLGRIHSAEDNSYAIEQIQASGIPQFNLDLMYGLPHQDVIQAATDLDLALAAMPTHISHYNLTIEPNTLFAVKRPTLPTDDVCHEIQSQCVHMLTRAGFEHYEVSAFAKKNCQSRHNLNYWRFGDYLGVGAGAHGKVTVNDTYIRTTHARHPSQYMNSPTSCAERQIATTDQPFEFMLNRLRLKEPLDLGELDENEGVVAPDEMLPGLQEAERRLLMEQTPECRWIVTPLGHRFLNDLQQIFLP